MTLRIDKVLSVIVFAVTPLIALAVFFIMKNIRRLFSNLQKKLEIISRTAAENLSGVRVVRAFSRQDYENKRFGNVSAEYKQIVIKTNKISALLNPLTSVIMNCGVIAILYFGQYRVSGGSQTVGSLTQGEITAFVNYMTQIFIALIVVMDIMLIFAKASVSASRINEVFDVKDEDEILTAPDVIAENVPAVALRNVSFSYGSRDKTVLKNINLSIAPGQTVGIIGITGAGKSTLVNLIIRLYDADAGTVEIYGKDIKTYSPNQLDAVFGYVPQSAVLFSGSIADNVRLGKANASADEIKAALKSAQAINFIDSLPDGIDHHVEEGGKNLSGGQRQRVAIARALVKQPNILILDDSASALDSVTDYNLRKEINTEFAESTVIIVAQRVASVKNADKIYVIDNGEIIDGGTHEYLYENCAVYGDICRSQSVKQL
jgi:ATP-binding cassette subfamily B protein